MRTRLATLQCWAPAALIVIMGSTECTRPWLPPSPSEGPRQPAPSRPPLGSGKPSPAATGESVDGGHTPALSPELMKSIDWLKAVGAERPDRVLRVILTVTSGTPEVPSARDRLVDVLGALGVKTIEPVGQQPLLVVEANAQQLLSAIDTGLVVAVQEDLPVGVSG